jgi:putative endonuclease
MGEKETGGWVYLMADRYRGTMYVGVTANLATRIHQHRGGTGSDFCHRYGLTRLVWAERCDTMIAAIAHEKRLKRWRRVWKFDLIEGGNPEWRDLSDTVFAGL